jgi:hypothetical protein
MLGTISIIVVFVLRLIHFSLWIIVSATIANGFIGVHFPPGKAMMLRDRNMYWRTYFYSLPLQAILVTAVYGVGFGFGALL